MEKSKVMFLGEFEFTRKDDKKTKGYGYNVAQFYVKDKIKRCAQQTFYSNEKLEIDGAEVGDLVECEMEQSFSLGGRPSLVSISVVEKSTIFD